nr:single-stranded DNA-binding protein [uncultured Roseateles sp.]
MIKVTVAQATFETIDYKSKKDGSPQQLRKQSAYAHTVDENGDKPPFPEKFSFLLNRDQKPFAVGEYTLHPSAFFIDRDGSLACRPRLTPVLPAKS